MWFPVAGEIFGSTKNMIWMMNEKNEMALFKPDPTGVEHSAESTIYQIATFFEIPYSRVIPYTLNNITGYLSIVEDTYQYHRINAYDFYHQSNEDFEYSIKGFPKECFQSLCKVAFLDTLCKNGSRHFAGIDFLMNDSITVAPLYDSEISLSDIYGEYTELHIDHSKKWTHQEVFHYLKSLDFMQDIIAKINTEEFKELCHSITYGDFIYQRAVKLLQSERKCPSDSLSKEYPSL